MKYYLVNTVSKRRTKMARKAAPAPQKYAQRFCGGSIRLPRGKHHPISAEQLEKHRSELEKKQLAGAVEVREGSPVGPIFSFGVGTEKKAPETAAAVKEEPVSAPKETEEEPDYAAMTNKELVDLILEVSDEWPEKELRKMKKAELLEIVS